MDLPTCPACGQSVLDDVEECPFCGASMSGKPSKKPASAAPPSPQKSSPSPKPSEPASSSSAGTLTGEAESQTADDDPFAVKSSAGKGKAIPLSPRPKKGRSRKFVCPMCETPGYASSKVAGKEVRCANPECLVPVFTAPEIKSQEPSEPAPETSGVSSSVIVSVAIVLVLGVAFGVWYFVLREDGQNTQALADNSVVDSSDGSDSEKDSFETLLKPWAEDSEGDGDSQAALPRTPAEMQGRTLERMIEAAQARSNNRSKPYCRRLTAEAFAEAGDLAGARKQLQQLRRLEPRIPFYEVTPLVAIAWQELKAGHDADVRSTLDAAWEGASSLPEVGRDAIDSATALSVALVAVGREGEARTLVGKHEDSGPVGQLSARLQIVREFGTYDLNWPEGTEPVLPWTAPQAVAVTLSLAAHGEWDAAFSWAQGHPELEGRTESLVAWADAWTQATLRLGHTDRLQRLETADDDLPPAAGARLFSRVANRLADGDASRAKQFLGRSKELLNSVSVPPEYRLPGMKGLYSLTLPDPEPYRMAAVACAETARAELALGRSEQAWATLLQGLQFTRGMAPSLPAIQQRLQEIDTAGSAVLRNRLRTVLELNSNDEALRAFRNYRQQCRTVENAARSRLNLQVSLLNRASEWDLLEDIWKQVRQRAKHEDVNQREPYFQTSLPWTLAQRFQEQGAVDRVQEIKTAAGTSLQADPEADMKLNTSRLIEAGKLGEAAQRFPRFVETVPEAARQQWIMQLACRLVNSTGFESASQFVLNFDDPLLREDTLELTAALAARSGATEPVWRFVGNSQISATERVAVGRGLIGGIAVEPQEPVSEVPKTDQPE